MILDDFLFGVFNEMITEVLIGVKNYFYSLTAISNLHVLEKLSPGVIFHFIII